MYCTYCNKRRIHIIPIKNIIQLKNTNFWCPEFDDTVDIKNIYYKE